MFAIIKCGSKQYRVAAGEKVSVEKLPLSKGQEAEFKDVLLVADGEKVSIGRPVVEGAVVKGVVEGEKKGVKLYPLKKKRRKNYRRRIGHRQVSTVVAIKEIISGGLSHGA